VHVAQHAATIEEKLAGNTRGKIFIYGTSSGGRNAVDLAVTLSNRGIPLTKVAALDAAFFPDESKVQPENPIGEPTVIPQFDPPGSVAADRKQSFFQTKGNHSTLTRRGVRFTSSMSFGEIHGQISGFTSEDLTNKINKDTDPNMHVALSQAATGVVHQEIQAVLDSL